MKPIKEKAEAVLAIVFRGLHNVPSSKGLRPHGNGFEIDVQPSQLSTFDFAGLTRLVFAAHDECCRVGIMSSGPRLVKLTFHDRKRSDEHVYARHPSMEAALAEYRKDHQAEEEDRPEPFCPEDYAHSGMPGHLCPFERASDGKRCNVWMYPQGHDGYQAEHAHTFTCGKPCGIGDSCDEDEGHTGPCYAIPF